MTRRNFRTFVSGGAEISIVDQKNDSIADSISSGFISQSSGNKDIDALLVSLSGIFKNLDNKIESIKARIDGEPDTNIILSDCETINISGSGVLLKSGSRLEVGNIVIIRMNLFTYPNPLFECCGRVVRSDSKPTAEGRQYYTGIEFINIHNEQRDKLISYTFQQQRKYIRAFNNSDRTGRQEESDPSIDTSVSTIGTSGRL